MSQKPKETWIINGILVTQDEQRTVKKAHLQIVDGAIVAMTSSDKKIPSQAKVIDASGLFILPGFIQPHIHLCQTLFRNMADDLELLDWLSQRIWPFEASHTYDTLYLSAMLGIHELLTSGTTCILDMGTVRHTEAIYQAVKQSGIRANVGKCLMDHPETSPPYLKEETQSALAEAQALYEKWHGQAKDRIRASYAPRFAVSCTDELFQAVAELAKSQGALIHTHSSENQKEIELVKQLTGKENIDYLHAMGLLSERTVLAHCVWLKSHEINKILKTGTHITHCPSSNLKLASGFAKIPELQEKGINVGLAMDGAPCNNNMSILQEMRLAGLMHKPGRGPRTLPAPVILDMATRNGAKALNWFDQIGSLEVGKQADMVALDLKQVSNFLPYSPTQLPTLQAIASAIVYATQPSQVLWTMVQGQIVAKRGRSLKISQKLLQPEAIEQAQRNILKSASQLLG